MALKRKTIVFSFSLLIIVTITALTTLIVLFLYAPSYLETRLIPELAKNSGLPEVQCDVRRIGWNGTDLGSVRIGSGEAQTVSVDSVQIDYSLLRLYSRKIDRILVSGIVLYCEIKDGNIALRGLDLSRLLNAAASSQTTAPAAPSQPVLIKALEIRNATLACHWNERQFRLPFELQATFENSDRNILQCRLRLFPRGQLMTIEAETNLHLQTIRLKVEADAIQLDRFTDFTRLIPGLVLSGQANFAGEADIDLAPFTLSSASVAVDFLDRGSAYGNIRFRELRDPENHPLPVRLAIRKVLNEDWHFSLNAVAFDSPLPLKISEWTTTAAILPDAAECTGRFRIAVPKIGEKEGFPFELTEPIESEAIFSAKLSANRQWEFKIKSPPETPPSPKRRPAASIASRWTISCDSPALEIAGEGTETEGTLTCRISVPTVRAQAEAATITIPVLNFNTQSDFKSSQAGSDQRTSFHLTALNTQCTSPSASCTIPSVSIDGQWKHQPETPQQLDGRLTIKSGRLLDRNTQTELRGIHLDFPFEWPPRQSRRKGSMAVKSIRWQKRKIASLRGSLQQKDAGLIFNAVIHNLLFSEMKMRASGQVRAASPEDAEAQIRFTISNPASAPQIDWSRLLPQVKGLKTSGSFDVATVFKAGPGGIESTLQATVADAALVQANAELSVEGIHLNLFIPDLLRLRSAPAQNLSFEKAALNNLNITKGSIDFQIESERSFLIEKSSFKWCNGNISGQAFRLQPGIEDYNLTLYCDRVNLAMLLEQLGIGIAEGQGAVNGRIPVRFHQGKIRFDDAFLYSTPGDGGKIHLEKTEILTAGIPSDTPQYNQLELVREALKDFDYQWAKVSLLTRNESLLLKVQFDGKPARPLPFIYSKDFGGFVRVETGGRGSEFKGIRLDINFNMPLDKILQYKDIFQNIYLN